MKRIRSNRKWKKYIYNKPRKSRQGYYFKQEKKQKKIVVRIIWIIFTLLLIQSIFHARYFSIKEISLENNKDISLAEIEESLNSFLDSKRFFIFKNNNYFLINKSNLEDILATEYNLESIKIKKIFPAKLNIIIQEKISYFIWQKDNSLYLLTSQGSLNSKISDLDEEYDSYPILVDLRSQNVNKEQIFNNLELDYINKIYLLWQKIIEAELKIKKIYIEDNEYFKIETNFGYNVILDKEKDIKEQLNNFNKILLENIIGTEIDYIDLRFGNKVYFK